MKKVRKLLASASERKKSGLFVIEGTRLFAEAPADLVELVLVSEEYSGDVASLCTGRATGGPETSGQSGYHHIEMVQAGLFRELSDTVNPQGILAVVRQPEWKDVLQQAENKAGTQCPVGEARTRQAEGRILLLDGIRDPGNLGTIVRTAEAAGVRFIVMSPDCVDLYNPKVIRSTMGSIFRVPTLTAELESVIRKLQDQGIPVYGTSLSATRSYKEADLTGAGIVIGSEANGISEGVRLAVTDNIKIPMQGQIESLNAAVSAAILMFC